MEFVKLRIINLGAFVIECLLERLPRSEQYVLFFLRPKVCKIILLVKTPILHSSELASFILQHGRHLRPGKFGSVFITGEDLALDARIGKCLEQDRFKASFRTFKRRKADAVIFPEVAENLPDIFLRIDHGMRVLDENDSSVIPGNG